MPQHPRGDNGNANLPAEATASEGHCLPVGQRALEVVTGHYFRENWYCIIGRIS